MHTYYRMCPKNSAHEARRPRYQFDKLGLARLCLRSYIEGFADIKPHITFLFDSCPPEWDEMVKQEMKWEYDIEHLDVANQNTSYLIQLDRARDVNDYVMFQEDDYIYLPNVGQKMLDALKVLEFVNPYDHLEFYTRNSEFHKPPFEIKLVGQQHWRTIDFDTMTWGCHSERLNKYWETLHKRGFWDKDTWDLMAMDGAKLWTPIPSLCTHMHRDFMAPGIDWERRMDELDK